LTGIEIAWRWLVGVVLLALGSIFFRRDSAGFNALVTAVQDSSVFQPVTGVHNLQVATALLLESAASVLRWMIPVVAVLWLLASAFGRTLLWQRLDPSLKARRVTLLGLITLRAALLTVVWMLWLWTLGWAVRVSITGPAARGVEPNVVFFCGIVIVTTLALYVLWAVLSWPLQIAPLLAMQRDFSAFKSLQAAFGCQRELRSKLIETNLVMCIVRLALIVLAMVLSASPLAFQTVATREFFVIWWIVAILVYFAASDYFHVVRAADYLKLLRTYESLPGK
jgi:hypothetical protein